MSDSNAVVVSDPLSVEAQEVSKPSESKEEFVKRAAYENVSKDMHKYKNRTKEAEALASELEARLKSIEDEKLMETQQWEQLYKKEKEAKEQLELDNANKQKAFDQSVKMSRLKTELGGNVKDAYLSFANLSGIELREDGSVDPESLHRVANEFRQQYPELIPGGSSAKISNPASPNLSNPMPEKSLSDMSYEEKAQLLKELKNRS